MDGDIQDVRPNAQVRSATYSRPVISQSRRFSKIKTVSVFNMLLKLFHGRYIILFANNNNNNNWLIHLALIRKKSPQGRCMLVPTPLG